MRESLNNGVNEEWKYETPSLMMMVKRQPKKKSFSAMEKILRLDLSGDDGEPINFAGKLEAGNGTGAFDEGVELLKVDNMAEGVWNYYLGRSSKWHYYHKGLMYEIAQ
ncbi:hypothetical protein OPV22_008873 [Ensete ventricosum]|uniref:Uncharacterized protein n=1 Tax=Ensete ventricosum TaxID=4639 RepID=A0AAV8RDR7_ENSVE|nr:hypothetical protein OPV22_008873 [Ensete ventricosum]